MFPLGKPAVTGPGWSDCARKGFALKATRGDAVFFWVHTSGPISSVCLHKLHLSWRPACGRPCVVLVNFERHRGECDREALRELWEMMLWGPSNGMMCCGAFQALKPDGETTDRTSLHGSCPTTKVHPHPQPELLHSNCSIAPLLHLLM